VIDILVSGGPVMIPLGVASVAALAIIIERLWVLRRKNYLRDETITTLHHYLVSRQYTAATDYCRMNPGPFPHLVAALVANRLAPYDELKEILEDTGRRELMGLQRGLGALATIVAGAPLLGLLGTVLGMIQIFGVVATAGSSLAAGLAAGIAQALITTAAGLIIAIPALFVHSYLEARAVAILSEVEAKIVEFLHLVRQPSEAAESAEAAS
jgi:biopolymer transport protein ExbB